MNYEKLKSKITPILLVLTAALLIFTIVYVNNAVKKISTPVDNSLERVLLQEIAIKDDSIAARMLKREEFLQYIDSLKGADTTIINNRTNVIKKYYYETDRLNAISDTGNIQLLSTNLEKLKERRKSGKLVLRR